MDDLKVVLVSIDWIESNLFQYGYFSYVYTFYYLHFYILFLILFWLKMIWHDFLHAMSNEVKF